MRTMVLVFSGYNQRAVVAFLRVLELRGVKSYRIVAASSDDTILLSSYKDKVTSIRNFRHLELDEIICIIKKIKLENDISRILIPPTTEFLNRFLLDNRQVFENEGCIVPIVDKVLYEIISDKEKFWNLCQKEEIAVPSLIKYPEVFNTKFVAKPKCYKAKTGEVNAPFIVLNEEERRYFENNYSIDDFDFQEYIEGESFYLLFYFSTDGTVFKFSQKNIIQQMNGKSMIAAMSDNIHNSEVAEVYENLFRQVGYCGFVMVEVRKKNDLYYMIEANPRFWGPSQLFVDAGVPFFEAFLADYGVMGKKIKYREKSGTRYFWSTGIQGDLYSTSNCVFHVDNKDIFFEQYEEFINSDIYNRDDTIEIYRFERDNL